MPVNNFTKSLTFTLRWEGGYSNHPNDSGGATNMGVTQGTYNAWLKAQNRPPADVKSITRAEVEAIYFERYWKASRAQYLQMPLAMVVFDTAVNMGVGRSNQFIGEALGLAPSTKWQPEASKLIHAADQEKLALTIIALRMEFRGHRVITNASQTVLLKGWLNRDRSLLSEVLKRK